jgi:hypothetical protein
MAKLLYTVTPASIGALCGAIVNYTLMSFCIAADIVRPAPFLGLLPRYTTSKIGKTELHSDWGARMDIVLFVRTIPTCLCYETIYDSNGRSRIPARRM